MKIAVIVESFPSLSETFISNKVERLALRGHNLSVFCNKKNEDLYSQFFAGKKNIRIVIFNYAGIFFYILSHLHILFRFFNHASSFRHYIFRKFRVHIINKCKPDIIHFEFSGIGIDYLDDLNKLKGCKVVSCRGSAEKVKLLIYEERKEKFRQLLTNVDSIHCVSNDMKNTIVPYCKAEKKIFINFPSIDTVFFTKDYSKGKKQVKTILSVGRLTFQKGYITGLLAMRLLKKAGVAFRWIIVGTGNSYEEIIFQINQFQLQDYIILSGSKSRKEIKDLMNEADIYFLHSVYEGIANVALEAMSMELPVVCSISGGMDEVITHEQNGLLANVYDYEKMAENLLRLYFDESFCTYLGKNARKIVIASFNLDIQVLKFETVYQELLEAGDKKVKNEPITRPDFLKIGLIIPQFPSYTETFFLNQVIGLCQSGYHVSVFCSVKNNDPVLENIYHLNQYSNLKIIGLNFSRLGVLVLKNLVLHPLSFFRDLNLKNSTFKKLVFNSLYNFYFQHYSCDIYHFGYSGTAIAYLSILDYLKGKKVVSCLGTAENVKPLSEPGRKEKLNKLFSKVDKIHCVSAHMAETIKSYGANDEKIFINRPAIDTQFFLRKQPYLPHETIQILSIGRLVFQKGFVVGILAMFELLKSFKKFSWTIVGEGPEKEQLIFHMNTLGLNEHINLVGKKIKDEIYRLYEESDIFFLPSVSEGLANVVLEAMSMELPVVSSVNGGSPEAITHNVNGILCENYDYKAMAQELVELCTNFKKRECLGKHGKITVERDFSLKRYISVFDKEYQNLMHS